MMKETERKISLFFMFFLLHLKTHREDTFSHRLPMLGHLSLTSPTAWQCCGGSALKDTTFLPQELIKMFVAREKPIYSSLFVLCFNHLSHSQKSNCLLHISNRCWGIEWVTRIHSNKTLLSKFPWRKWTHKTFAADLFVQAFELFNINLAYKSLAPPFFIEVSGPVKDRPSRVCLEEKKKNNNSGRRSAHLTVIHAHCFYWSQTYVHSGFFNSESSSSLCLLVCVIIEM